MYVIYGLGTIGKDFVGKAVSLGIRNLTLTDSNSKLWGTELFGLEIKKPEEVLKLDYEKIIVTTQRDKYSEIKETLENIFGGDIVTRIVWYQEVVLLSKDEVYNLGDLKFKEELKKSTILEGKDFNKILGEMNDLEKIFFNEKHRIVSKWFHYFEAYERFFSKYRGKDVTVLEIGVYKGGSLQMWKNYFSTGNNKVTIYGIDIDPDCKKYEEENVHIFIGSQEDREFLRKVKSEIGQVDILLDDGGHTMNQQIVTLEEMFDCVKDDGIFMCEDLHTSYWEEYGGAYKGDSFIEYTKGLIDQLHLQYIRTNQLVENRFSNHIKSLSYYDSMVFIEKRPEAKVSFYVEIENQ